MPSIKIINEIYEKALERLEEIVLILDNNLKIVHFNRFASGLFKIQLKTAFNKNIFDLTSKHPISFSFNSEDIRNALKNKEFYNTGFLIVNNTQKINVMWNISSYVINNEENILIFGKMMIDLDKGEHQSNTPASLYLQNIVENLPEYIYWKDINKVYQGCNKHVADYLGLPNSEFIIGKTDNDFGWDEDRIKELNDTDNRILNTGKHIVNEDIIPQKDGTVRIMLTSKSPLFDDRKEKIIGILGISADITPIKEASESKSIFLSAMDHLIRTPLSSALGATQLLEQEFLPSSNEFNTLKIIFESIKEISPVLDRVRYYLDLEERKLEPTYSRVETKSYFDRHYLYFKQQASDKSLKFDFFYDNNISPWVKGGTHFLSHILRNLLANAIRYTSKGGISLIVNQLTKKENYIKLEIIVKDTGSGISSDICPNLFSMFEHQLSHTRNKFKNSGLNLSISAKMLELIQGTIRVHSEPGKGSEFILEIPFEIIEEPKYDKTRTYTDYYKKNVPTLIDKKIKGPLKVLYIEDHISSQKVMAHMLKKLWDCDLDQAYNLETALALLTKKYDMIFTDIQLPDGSALIFIRQSRLKNPDTPIIAVTAHVEEEEKIDIIEAGANEILEKPVDISLLKKVLHAYIYEKEDFDEED